MNPFHKFRFNSEIMYKMGYQENIRDPKKLASNVSLS